MSTITQIQIHPTKTVQRRLGTDFDGCTIDIPADRILIVGPNGSGKSTLSKTVRAATQIGRVDPYATKGSMLEEFAGAATVKWSGEASELIAVDGIADNRAMSPWINHGSLHLQLSAQRSSHGIGTVIQTGTAIKRAREEELPIWLDEADVSMDAAAVSFMMLALERVPQCVLVSHQAMALVHAMSFGWTIMEAVRGYTEYLCKMLRLERLSSEPIGLPWAVSFWDKT